MSVTRHKRQIFLFLAAIFVPAGALIGLASRLMYQDRELAAKRAVDQRRAAVDQVRRELSSRLEAIKLQEINRLMRPPGPSGARGSENPAVISVASLENDRLVLPWEAASPRGEPVSKEFAQLSQVGETRELIEKNYAAAAEAYRLALASAKRAGERGEARLALARTLVKAGRAGDASSQYRLLLSDPAEARDEQGVGYRIYAAERLLAAGRDSDAVRSFLGTLINGDSRLTLPELYMIRPLISSPPDIRTGQKLAERIVVCPVDVPACSSTQRESDLLLLLPTVPSPINPLRSCPPISQ